MSLIDLILERQIILISVTAALIPLALALLLVIVRRFQRYRVHRAERRQAAQEEAVRVAVAAEMSRRDAEGAIEEEPDDLASAPAMPFSLPAPAPTASMPPPPAPVAAPTGSGGGASGGGDIQSVLSTVFVDEETSKRHETLLHEAQPIDTAELAELANRIAGSLRQNNPS